MHTDIGPIPRDILLYPHILHASIQYLQTVSNWNTKIDGCYWCCANCLNYASIFCSKECFFLFNEWCFMKLKGYPAVTCCKYLSCPNSTESSSQCCSIHNRKYPSEFGKLINLLQTSNYILGPKWYHNGYLPLIDFYNRDEPFYEFTNFFPCPSLKIDGIAYPTSEHYFQSQKFVGTPYILHISDMSHPRDAFDFSRSNKGNKWIRPDWSKVKEQVMYRVLREKFTQNPVLAYMLISTCNAHLYEHTSNDSFWGDGGDDRAGQNKLGLLLMELRSELQTLNTYIPNNLGHHSYEELFCLISPSPIKHVATNEAILPPQFINTQTSEVNFNLKSIKDTNSTQNSFNQHRNTTDSEWLDDDVMQSNQPVTNNECTSGTFNQQVSDEAGHSDRPPPFNPAFGSNGVPTAGDIAHKDQDNSEVMETVQQNPFGVYSKI
ncbi:Riboflavin biosynthesis protein PYRR, chloroplastic-like [Oopsacas minuta]|uniref:Riboflavin biosynthesis protein PYRR, chloroplastic-like n=1 Tax=Oopsacas minuta TaxID=111878 RepID=A0AAV7K6P7_9METZ|nr:Riboflavin biosynthesis protein PYRR, chloroplastic-like [Oopsacas minuta]